MKDIARCCLRLLPDWPHVLVEMIDACFTFPDSIVRGLLWQSVLFALNIDERLDSSIRDPIKDRIAPHLFVKKDFEFYDLVVDGFLGDTWSGEYRDRRRNRQS